MWGGFFVFFFHFSLLSVSLILLGGRVQLSKQMWPVRWGGGDCCHLPDSLSGTWKSSSSSPGPPSPFPLPVPIPLSQGVSPDGLVNQGSFSLGLEQTVRWWTLALPIVRALNSPSRCTSSTNPSHRDLKRSRRAGGGLERGSCCTEHVRWLCKLCSDLQHVVTLFS